MTQKALAEAIGSTPETVSRYEQRKIEIGDDIVDELARTLRFPRSFFALPDPQVVDPASVSFRALSKLSAARRQAVISASTLGTELVEHVTKKLTLPAANVPTLREVDDPELAADATRGAWGLGE